MSTIEDGTMTAETMQSGDFEARVTEIVNRILAHNKPRPQRTDPDREIALAERFVRVEEELKHQREVMIAGFAQSDKRFEDMNKRFEQVDKRFEEMREDMNRRFDESLKTMNARFEQVDKRFEEMIGRTDRRFEDMNKRFEQVDKRFEDMRYSLDKQVSTLRWSFGIITTLILAAMTAYRFIT